MRTRRRKDNKREEEENEEGEGEEEDKGKTLKWKVKEVSNAFNSIWQVLHSSKHDQLPCEIIFFKSFVLLSLFHHNILYVSVLKPSIFTLKVSTLVIWNNIKHNYFHQCLNIQRTRGPNLRHVVFLDAKICSCSSRNDYTFVI